MAAAETPDANKYGRYFFIRTTIQKSNQLSRADANTYQYFIVLTFLPKKSVFCYRCFFYFPGTAHDELNFVVPTASFDLKQ